MATIEENLQKLKDTKINIKNAIVAKGVSMDNVPFTDYASKIAQIETGSGGGGTGDGQYKVRVIDYDGTIIKEENLNTGDTFTLPDAPTHDRLTFQEWVSADTITGNTVTVANRDIQIGAIYKTTSGNTEFDIVLTKVTGLTVNLQNLTGMTSINWGDGTTDSSLSHTYSDYGSYTIEVAGVTALDEYIFTQSSSVKNYYCVAARLSDSVTYIRTYTFCYCYSLASITIPNSVRSIALSTFSGCYSLISITIPSNITRIPDSMFASCYSLTSITIPSSVIDIRFSAFYYCYSLTSITIPNSVTSIGNYAFQNCYSLTSITIPNNVTSIGSYVFGNCYSIKKYDFTSSTSVPTLSNTSAFSNINGIYKIYVPDELYDEWIAATNWVTYADYIYKASEMEN